MAKTTTMTFRVDPEVSSKLDELARLSKRSRSAIMTAALEGYVAYEQDIVSGIQKAQQEVRAGAAIDHDEAMEELRAHVKSFSVSRRDAVA